MVEKAARKKKGYSLERQRSKYGYLFTAPLIIGAALTIIYPIILSVIYSFGEIIPSEVGYSINFLGFDNYHHILFVDGSYNQTLVATLQSTFSNVPVVVIFSFFLASVLNGNFIGRGAARTVLFLPFILMSNIVQQLMNADAVAANISQKSSSSGMYSALFSKLLGELEVGNSITSILTSSVDNIGNLLAMAVIPTIIILAGLQSVPRSVYEASYMEGATQWEVFWKISLPIVSPMLLVSLVYCIIDSFTSISNEIITKVRYICFTKFEFGLGSAMAWIYLLIVLIIVLIVYLVVNRFVSYSD